LVQRTYPDGKYNPDGKCNPDGKYNPMDSAAANTAITTQKFLAEFWTLADWPPYLPDLNQLDFLSGAFCRRKSR
jgi:hypothetical protein